MDSEKQVTLYGAIDVGTGSVRVALFTANGEKKSYAQHQIETLNPTERYYEQSTEDIWRAVLHCLRAVTSSASTMYHSKINIAAIGIDATCSLVACLPDEQLSPLPITSGHSEKDDGDVYNVLLWLDSRATAEAAEISAHQHPAVQTVTKHFGGTVSPEGELAKLLWISRYNDATFSQAIFFDLADWLAAKLTGDSHKRSTCTLACKWGWGASRNVQWDAKFWSALGLPLLTDNDFFKIAPKVTPPASAFGTVSSNITSAVGLSINTIVASPVVDAYAGAVWGLSVPSIIEGISSKPDERLCMVAGTSTCFLQLSDIPLFVKGVWGPFKDALVPGMHVLEGGQSVTGKLLQNIVECHPAYAAVAERVGEKNVFDELSRITEEVVSNSGHDPSEDIHCLDYHGGNRSPLADPGLKGCFIGLTLAHDEWDLATKFRATVQALCYGARHIVEEMRGGGLNIGIVTACGGLCKSRLFLTELADCLQLPVLLSKEEDTVLLGGAILAQAAYLEENGENNTSSTLDRIIETAARMCEIKEVILHKAERGTFHDRKYKVYRKMHQDFVEYRRIMNTQE